MRGQKLCHVITLGQSEVTSSEGNHFKTTPLPRHGPGAGYGYTTTNSFVNVHFGDKKEPGVPGAPGGLGAGLSLSTSLPVRQGEYFAENLNF